MNFEEEYAKLHFDQTRISEPIFYLSCSLNKILGVVSSREVREFGVIEDLKSLRSVWELETFKKSSDFYKRIQNYLPMVVNL